jgi:hypothetical protein
MQKTLSFLSAAVLLSVLTAAPASAQQVTSITASWQNDSPDAGVNRDNTNLNSVRVCWPGSSGTTDDGDSPNRNCSNNDLEDISGYSFNRASTPINPTLGSAFSLGTFTHYNNPISGTSLNSVELALSFVIGGTNVNSSWLFSHNETPNVGGGNCCNDLITISALGTVPLTFMFNSAQYSLEVLGFGDTPLQAPNLTYSTRENNVNSTQVWAVVNRTQVAEPATLSLVAAGLMGLVGVARRRRDVA